MLAGEVQQPSTRSYRPELHGEAGCQLTVNTHKFRLSGLERGRGGRSGARPPFTYDPRVAHRLYRCALPSPTHPPAVVAAKTPATSRARDVDYLLDDNYVGQNMTEHNPAPSPSGRPLLSGPPPPIFTTLARVKAVSRVSFELRSPAANFWRPQLSRRPFRWTSENGSHCCRVLWQGVTPTRLQCGGVG